MREQNGKKKLRPLVVLQRSIKKEFQALRLEKRNVVLNQMWEMWKKLQVQKTTARDKANTISKERINLKEREKDEKYY